jgi:hypothetical protein
MLLTKGGGGLEGYGITLGGNPTAIMATEGLKGFRQFWIPSGDQSRRGNLARVTEQEQGR